MRGLAGERSRFPWVILVPRQAGLREMHDLSSMDQIQLMGEITHISHAMQEAWSADKTNVAALGNMVPQLHVHIVMRFEKDAAWPGPIWGVGSAEPYSEAQQNVTLEKLRSCLP